MLGIKITQQKLWLGKKEVFHQNFKQHTSLTNIVRNPPIYDECQTQ